MIILYSCHDEQTFDLFKITIISFHENTGTRVDTYTEMIDSKIVLKTVGIITQSLAASNHCDNNIQFAFVTIDIELSPVTNEPSSLNIETFIELP